MNIFVLDTNPELAAQYHCDIHLNKMILETAQLLSTAHWHRGGSAPYKATHANHPCAYWARATSTNYQWLSNLFANLLDEYKHRYNKEHKCENVYLDLCDCPKAIKVGERTEFAVVMPDVFKIYYGTQIDVVASYQNYYNHKELMFKRNKMKWTNRDLPEWYKPAAFLPNF